MSYESVVEAAIHLKAPLNPDRFVKISDRKEQCDIPKSAWKALLENAYLQTWKGVLFDKGPTETMLYSMLLHELQPKTVIEIGAMSGGSAMWLADHLELFKIKGAVYGIDINLSLLDEKAKNDDRVHFLEGDCNNMAAIMPPEMLSKLEHPWLIIEDAHANAVGVVDYFHNNGLQKGDYMIVEDTNKTMWEIEWEDWDDVEVLDRGQRKLGELTRWLMLHAQEYRVDSYYQDLYGYNGSKNWNSILKKV